MKTGTMEPCRKSEIEESRFRGVRMIAAINIATGLRNVRMEDGAGLKKRITKKAGKSNVIMKLLGRTKYE